MRSRFFLSLAAIMLLVLAAGSVRAEAAPQTASPKVEETVRKAIEDRYARYVAAVIDADITRVVACLNDQMTDDFIEIEPDGQKTSREDVFTFYRHEAARRRSFGHYDLKIRDLTMSGPDAAVAVVDYDVDYGIADAEGKIHRVTWKGADRDIWVRRGKEWKQSCNIALEKVGRIDSKPYDPTDGIDNTTADAQTLTAIEKELSAALLKGDPAPFQKYLSDGCVLIGSDGSELDKSDFFGFFKDVKYEKYDFQDMKVRTTGDTAQVIYRTDEKCTYKGQVMTNRNLWVDTFLRRAGRWQLIASQATALH